MTTDIAARRGSIENEISALRRKRVVDTLGGSAFTGQGRLTHLQNELEGLDDSVSEQARRERVDAEASRRLHVERLKEYIVAEEQKRLAAIDEAQIALNTYHEQLEKFFAVSADMAQVFHALHRSGPPTALNPFEIARRVAGALAAKMTTLAGHKEKLGPIKWSGHGLYHSSGSWAEREQRLLQPSMEKIKPRDDDANSND